MQNFSKAWRCTLSIQLLKTLIAISECGSFSEAAKRVCVSQAAVGQQMKRLESLVGSELFSRSNSAPAINNKGRSLVSKAREVVHAYENLISEIQGDTRLQGELVLGAVPSTIRALIPISIKKLIKKYPELHIRVVSGTSSELLEQVERGALDAAVLSTPNKFSSILNWAPMVEEELVLLTSQEGVENDPEKLLKSLPYVRLTRRTAVGQLADDWLSENKLSVQTAMEMDSLETLSSMIAHNLGVSVVPNFCVQDPIFASLRKIKLKNSSQPRVLGMLTRSDCPKLGSVDALLTELKQTTDEHALK